MEIFVGTEDSVLISEKSLNINKCWNIRRTICFLSIYRLFALISLLVLIFCLLIIFKSYLKIVLLWLETQNVYIVTSIIIILFIIVAFPISVGYIILVVASGYLFDFSRGLLVVVVGANFGLIIAHSVLKIIGYNKSVQRLIRNETAQAIIRVISGSASYKIVFCSRLTPIPFGLQNTIFALSDVNPKIYYVASFFGLFPAQFFGVYCGSTLRSMQDVLDNRGVSPITYFFIICQLVFALSLMVWFSSKARLELVKALNQAENNYNIV